MIIPQFFIGVDLTYSGLYSLLIEQEAICLGTEVGLQPQCSKKAGSGSSSGVRAQTQNMC
jgi:hypothetical protein